MSGIEKIFGTNAQYDELYDWLSKNRPEMLERMRVRRNDLRPDQNFCIAHFGQLEDIWLWNYCPFKWVIDRIWEQYGGSPTAADTFYSYTLERCWSRPGQYLP